MVKFGSLLSAFRSLGTRLATNLATYSDPTAMDAANFPLNSGAANLSYVAGAISGFSGSIHVTRGAGTVFMYKQQSVTTGLKYTLSVYIQMDDGTTPIVGATSGGPDLSIYYNGAYVTPVTLTQVSATLYRASVVATAVTTGTVTWGVVKAAAQTVKQFSVTGFQFEQGTLSGYIPTTNASVTTNTSCLIANSYGDPVLSSITQSADRS